MGKEMSTVFKFRFFKHHIHTVVSMFAGPDSEHLAKCGDLVFLEKEWTDFRSHLFATEKIIIEEKEDK